MGRHRAVPVAFLLWISLLQVTAPTASGQVGADVTIHKQLTEGAYAAAETDATSNVARVSANYGADSLPFAAALDQLVSALELNGKGALEPTREYAERALAIKQARLGSGDRDLVMSLVNLGDSLLATAEYTRAVDVLQRAVALSDRGAATDARQLANSLDHLGRALALAGRSADAGRVLERSLTIREPLGNSDLALADTLESQWLALQLSGDFLKAGIVLRKALDIRGSAGEQHPRYVSTLNSLALQWLFEGEPVRARETATRCLRLAESALRPDHPEIARALKYRGSAALDLGDIVTAKLDLSRALEIARQNLGSRHAQMWMYPNDLAGAERLLGNYMVARRLLEEARKVAVATYGEWHDSVATAVHNLALVDASLGDYSRARAEHVRALTIWERLRGPNHPFVAVALVELATVYREQGAPAEALPLLERALAIREERLGMNHPDVMRTLADLADTLIQTGQASRAGLVADRALAIMKGLDTPDAPDLAVVLAVCANVESARGDAGRAADYYERAIAIRIRSLGADHPAVADAEIGLARALAMQGRLGDAFGTAVGAERIAREHLRLMLTSLPERQALTYAYARPNGKNLILSLAGTTPESTSVSLDTAIRSRALVLDQMAARRASLQGAPGDLRFWHESVVSSQQRLANLLVRGPGPLTAAQYIDVLARARQERDLAEQEFAVRNAEFKLDRTRANLGLDDIVQALPNDAALVSIFRYERTSFPAAGTSPTILKASPRAEYVAYVIGRDRSVQLVRLGLAAAIDKLVRSWRDAVVLEAQSSQAADGKPQSSRLPGNSLREQIWDPLQQYLAGASRVFVVPDGLIALVPFAALPSGKTNYVLEAGPLIHYLSTERDLVMADDPHAAPTNGMLAVGGPAFNTWPTTNADGARPTERSSTESATRGLEIACPSFETMSFRPLRGTLEEVKDIAGRWNSRVSANGLTASVLIGVGADEASFKRMAPGRKVLHMATHGFFVSESCVAGGDESRSVGGLVKSRRRPQTADNPLLLSGLALAGANRRQNVKSGQEDGILTAEEVAAMNLSGTEWAVLSACDTGLGEVRAGEGVFGLRRAFQVAGVRTVIMSLWSVADRSTVDWMRALYEGRLQKNLDTAEAVREASLTVLHQRRAKGLSTHPFYWAGFVASGDWR